MAVVAGVVPVEGGALAAVHPVAVHVIVPVHVAIGVRVAIGRHAVVAIVAIMTIMTIVTIDPGPRVPVSGLGGGGGRVAGGAVGGGVPVVYARHAAAVVVRAGVRVVGLLLGGGRGLAPGHHVVPVHVVGLGHARRLARGPAEGLRLGRRHGLVDAGLGRRQWLVVRIPGRRIEC